MTDLIATHLRCEQLVEPLAVERPQPRLGWIPTSTVRGAVQVAYRVQAAGSVADLEAGRHLLWDSGRVDSPDVAHIPYAGTPLTPFQRVCWRVQLWDRARDPSPWSAASHWAMGVCTEAAWQGSWIGFHVGSSTNTPCLRRRLSLTRVPVDARLYATARGIFTATIDGAAVGNDVFAAGWTDYRKRILYRCWDVTALLRSPGEHVLGAMLNDGWYRGPMGWTSQCAIWGSSTDLLMMLRLVHADGSIETICTDREWRTKAGPVLNSTFMRGEIYDAGLALPGWDRPGYDDGDWYPAAVRERTAQVPIQTHPGPPVRRLLEVRPVDSWQPRPGTWLLDFGQNLAGRVRIRLDAPAGTTIRMRHAEILTPQRTLYTDNLRAALSIDTYTCVGGGEVYEPIFTFHGFQYVEITGWPGKPSLDDVTAVVVGSDCPTAGRFSCSSQLVNQLYSNLVWTQRANFIEVPTDCPQRDERLGWTGDAQAFIRTAICNNDVAAFFTKWLTDLRDAQTSDGAFPNIAPMIPGLVPDRGDAGWGDAGTICPWTIYRCYGDREVLVESYPAMVRWIEYLDRTAIEGVHIRFQRDGLCMFGDWLAVDSWTPGEVIMTAFFAYSVSIVRDVAKILGLDADVQRFDALHGRIVASFARSFVRPDGRVIGWRSTDDTQTGYVLGLHFDLIPEDRRSAAIGHLVRLIEARGFHLSTGFLGLPYLLPVLCRFGRADVAFRLLNNTTYPSWGYSIAQGATTIWERWNGWTRENGPADPNMNSYSHYAYGAVGDWLFSDVAGIDLTSPGFVSLRIRPRIGGGITHADAEHTCIRGRIRSSWRLEKGMVDLAIEVPVGSTAEVQVPTSDPTRLREGDGPWTGKIDRTLPGYATVSVGSGSWRFTAPAPADG